MNEAECLGMKRLPATNGETIFNKLFVFSEHSSFYNLITTIIIIIEKRVADIFHVYPYLVCSSCFQNAFDKCYIIETLQNFIVRYRVFTMVTFRIGLKLFPVTQMSSYMRLNSTF